MHNIFDLKELLLNLHELVSLVRVLPLLQKVSYVWIGQLAARHIDHCLLVDRGIRCKILSEIQQEVVQKNEGGSLRVLWVRDCGGRYSVSGCPAVTLANVLF